jgi:hypothetical protein
MYIYLDLHVIMNCTIVRDTRPMTRRCIYPITSYSINLLLSICVSSTLSLVKPKKDRHYLTLTPLVSAPRGSALAYLARITSEQTSVQTRPQEQQEHGD